MIKTRLSIPACNIYKQTPTSDLNYVLILSDLVKHLIVGSSFVSYWTLCVIMVSNGALTYVKSDLKLIAFIQVSHKLASEFIAYASFVKKF